MTTVYKARSAWTSQPRGGAALAVAGVLGMADHWPGSTTNAYGVETEAKVASRLRGWWDYHVNVRGWADIGYNFAIDQAGRVWDLRGSGRVGAHAASAGNPDANREWIGVLHILGDEEEPTAAMVQAHWDFRRTVLLPRFPRATRDVGHGQVPGASTECPGREVLQLVQAGAPTVTPPRPPAPKPPTSGPVVDLSKLVEAARIDPPRASSKAAYPSGTRVVEAALVAEGLLARARADQVGHFGSDTVAAYAAWQRRLGYRGADADGIPGRTSLERLGTKRGFRVTA